MLSLVVVRGPDRGRAFALPDGEPQLIGRSTEALEITDPTVSRRHAELTPDAGRWRIRDLESRHGTFVNGVRISGAVTLSAGDRVRCGDSELLLLREGESPPLASDEAEGRQELDAPGRDAGTEDSTAAAVADLDAARIARELVARAAEPIDADAFLSLAARALAETLGCEVLALRAADARLEDFVVPGANEAPSAPLSLVRRAIDRAEPLAAGDEAVGRVLAAPFGAPGAARGAFLLRWTGDTAVQRPRARDIAAVSAAAEVASLALAARGERPARGSQERLALIGETVAALSHSIKNMLQGLRFGADAVDLALSRGELVRAREGWPVLQRNLDRVHALALNMLAWAKERPLEPEPTDANAILREVRELLAPAAARRRVGVLLELDEALPPAALDSPSIHQALTNLVLNAIEAAPERVGMVTLGSRYDIENDAVVLSVRDNGAGIPDAVRGRLFEPFVSSKGQRGTGLGLAVARKIAERHGGRLEVMETSSRGTVFALTLPASADGSDPDETRAPRAMRPSELSWRFE
ncbi:MAG: FHA domain-containing protein [Phycisphaera sp.]|nr:FHA domain-containing protein [Phycisphaera sp.]